MPRNFDNIEASLLPALEQTLELSRRADLCVGYCNLRGWKELNSHVEVFILNYDIEYRLGLDAEGDDE